mmetsp:Transcript_25585/g.76824  ORF Transcript_25585/g.76824 Transcript_25585/m.76824 type:complete len:202 (+) Transcript_25585:579-1184(+)
MVSMSAAKPGSSQSGGMGASAARSSSSSSLASASPSPASSFSSMMPWSFHRLPSSSFSSLSRSTVCSEWLEYAWSGSSVSWEMVSPWSSASESSSSAGSRSSTSSTSGGASSIASTASRRILACSGISLVFFGRGASGAAGAGSPFFVSSVMARCFLASVSVRGSDEGSRAAIGLDRPALFSLQGVRRAARYGLRGTARGQ